MSQSFSNKKRRILDQLNTPAEEYSDASPKGTVDEGIRDLVDEINNLATLVTTSSCAGRLAVYLEGSKTANGINPEAGNLPTDDADHEEIRASVGGKGGGQWLFISHDPLHEKMHASEVSFMSMFGFSVEAQPSIPVSQHDTQWVHFKFEPMILHILADSLESAQLVLGAALGSGFRESGIASISNESNGPPMVMVAVRTAGLAFDNIIGFRTAEGDMLSMVSEPYLRVLVQLANGRFNVNKARTQRFKEALLARKSSKQHPDDWEPAEDRRARMRAEGLQRQAESKRYKDANSEA